MAKPIKRPKSDQNRSADGVRGRCSVCKHPNLLAIEAALTGSGDGKRKNPVQVAAMGLGPSYGAIGRHERECMKRDRKTIQAEIRSAAAPAQVESGRAVIAQAAKMTSIALAERELDAALALSAMADKIAKILADKVVSPDGEVNVDAVDIFISSLKATVEARGGGTHKWVEIRAKLKGELAMGNQTNIQINLEKRAPDFGRAVARWITDHLGTPIAETVNQSLGFTADKVAAALQRRMLAELATLAPLAKAALEAPVDN